MAKPIQFQNPLSQDTRDSINAMVTAAFNSNRAAYENDDSLMGQDMRANADEPYRNLAGLMHPTVRSINDLITGLKQALISYPEITKAEGFKELFSEGAKHTDSYNQLLYLDRIAESAGLPDRINRLSKEQLNAIGDIGRDVFTKTLGQRTDLPSNTVRGRREYIFGEAIDNLASAVAAQAISDPAQAAAREERAKANFVYDAGGSGITAESLLEAYNNFKERAGKVLGNEPMPAGVANEGVTDQSAQRQNTLKI